MSRLNQLKNALSQNLRPANRLRGLGLEKTPFKRSLLVETLEQRVLMAADPLSVARVSGSIDSAGEIDRFAFHLDNSANLAFDSLTNSPSLNWTLNGPSGTLVNQSGFQALSGNSGPYAPMALAAGDYTIDVHANGDATGAYDMRLLDLARATPINLNAPVSGSMDEQAKTEAFVFDGQAGDDLFLSWTTHPDSYLRIYDPYGQQVTSGYGQYYDGALPTLAYTGRYTVLLDASNSVTAGAAYNFTLHKVVAAVQNLGNLTNGAQSVNGTLAASGDTAVVRFSLTSPRSIIVDSLTNSDSLTFSLTGPGGAVLDSYGQPVTTRGLANYADHGYYGTGLIELAAGDYTLTLQGNGTTTGDYSLRLLNVAGGTAIAKSTVVSGQLSPGNSVQIYRFNASAGDGINFDALSQTGGNPSVKLLDPYGRRVTWGWGFSDLNDLTLNHTGQYTLVVSGENGRSDPTDFSFQLVDNGNTPPTPLPTGSALVLGEIQQDSIAAAGGSHVYNFSVGQATALYFDPQTISSNYGVYWSLTGPRGVEVSDALFGYYNGYEGARVINVPAGDYALVLRSDAALPDYKFRLLDLTAIAAPITVNTPVAGQLNPGSGAAAYTFDATADQRVYFQATSTSNGNLRWRLLDPDHREVVGNTGWYDSERVLPRAGRYTLVIEGFNNITAPIDYGFTVFAPSDKQFTYDPAISTGVAPSWTSANGNPAVVFDGQHDIRIDANPALNLTQNVSFQTRVRIDSFDQTWQAIVYKGPNTTDSNSRTYTLWANSGGYLYLTTSDNWGEMTVKTANGSIQTDHWYDVTGVINRTTGQMKIYVDGVEAATADIRTTQGSAKVQNTPLYLGNAHEGWGNNNNQLQGAIGDFRLWNKALTTAEVTQYLSTAPQATDTDLALWLKLDEGSGAAVVDATGHGLNGTIRSRFENVTGVAAGSIDVPGQSAVYQLSLPEAKTFYLDSLTPYNATVGGPFQLTITGPTINFNENLTYFNNRLITLPAGDYTFTVNGNDRQTGPYAFRLIDTASAQAFAYDATVTGTLNPGDTARIYAFDATAGESVYFQALSSTGFTPQWRLIDPFGREVFGRAGFTNRDPSAMAYTGRYLLIVDGDYSNYDQLGNFSFRLSNVPAPVVQPFNVTTGLDEGVQRTSGQGSGAVQVSDRQYIEFPNTPATDQTGSFSIDLDFRIDQWSAGSWIPLVTKTTTDALRQVGLFINNDGRLHLGAYPGNGGGYSSVESAGGTVSAGGWHHVTAVYDRVNSQLRIVLDGTQVASGYLNPLAGVDLDEPLRIGFNNEGYDFTGHQVTVDNFGLWNKALTTAEAALNATTPLTGAEAGLVALYKFNEATGSALTDTKGGAAGAIKRLAAQAGGLVTGRISEPGQSQRYQFTLTEPTQLYFDSFTRRYDIRWSLTGPGTSLANTLYSADSNNSYNLLNLNAGTYDILIDADGAATGDFMFRLIDAAGAQQVTLGQVVNGRLNPGQEAKIYRFDATAGQKIFFDSISYASQQPAWRLLDPTGAQVFGVNWMADRDTIAMPRTGTYTLILEDYTASGARNPARDFSFALRPITDVTKALTLGTSQWQDTVWTSGPVAGEQAAHLNGQQQILTEPSAALDLTGDFTIEAMVKFDGFDNTWTPVIHRGDSNGNHQTFGLYVGSSGQVNLSTNGDGSGWSLSSANGLIQAGEWYRISATLDRTTGIAKIYVDGVEVASANGDNRPAFSLPQARLHVGSSDMSDPSRAELRGSIADVRVWSVARTAAQILASKSSTLTGSEAGLAFNLKLDEGTGSTLTDSATHHLSTRLVSLYDGLSSTVVEGSLDQIGGRVVYNFTPAVDQKILFDSLTPDSGLNWSLVGPDGAVVDNYGQTLTDRRLRDSDAYSRVFFNLKAGLNYQLIVDGQADATGPYAFRLANFSDAQLVAYDTLTTWQPDQARSTQLFAFDGAAGDQIVFDRIDYTDTRPLWRAFDPSGREIFYNDFYYDSGTLTLAMSGRYTFALEGQIDSRGQQAQHFQVSKVGTTTPPALPTGTAVTFTDGTAAITGTLANANDVQVYTFTLAEAKRIYVDGLNTTYPDYYKTWTLAGPSGTVANFWSYDTDGVNRRGWYDLAAGDYAFSVTTPYPWATGNFKFNLLDMTTASTISVGANVTGTLDPAASTKVYRFEGTSGDRLFLQATAQSNMGNSYWRLIHADTGAELSSDYFGNNQTGVVLNRTGTYLLTIEGYYGTTGTASYGFTVHKNADITQAITLGTTVSASIVKPGDTQRYTFTLDAAKKLWFDSFTNRTDMVWRVLDADGISVTGDRYLSDYAGYNQSRLDLAAGQYTLVVDGNSAVTGDFSLRLLDLSAASAITPGTTVNGQLAPANETDLYKFTATAGDAFFFDVITRGSGNTYWRLLDPHGQSVFWNEGLYDHATTKLDYTGTYTLAIEGYPSDTGTVGYSFNVTPVLDQAPVNLDIGVLPAPNLVVQNLAVSGADGSLHSGGTVNVSWTTANTGERDVTLSFQERVVVKNAQGETIANVLVPYNAGVAGSIAAGANKSRSAVIQLPAGARGAGQITFSVITDVANAIAERGNAGEADNSAQVQGTSTLLIYPDLTVANIAITPSAGLLGGAQATVSWRVNNQGDKATTLPWADRVVVRNLSTGEVVLDQTTRVDAASAVITAGGFINRQVAFSWPDGRKSTGEFEISISTDVQGEVPEYNAADTGELNNNTVLRFTNAPDLQVSAPQVINTNPVSGDLLNLQWTVKNTGNTATPQGWFDRVQVINQTTGESLVNVDVFFDPVVANGSALAAGASITRTFAVRLPEGARSVGALSISISVDQNTSGASLIAESNEGNNTGQVAQTVTPKPYPDLTVSAFTAPATHRSGDSALFNWTVTNSGTAATGATSWSDRVLLSRDDIIGNGDDIALGTVSHVGALAAGASYLAQFNGVVPGGLDGDYHVAIVTDAFSAVVEPDTRTNNVSAVKPLLLTAYHADLVPAFTTVPATATGGDTMTVSWQVTNNGDSATNQAWWYDQIWLSTDGTLGAGAIQVGTWARNGALVVGESYQATQQVLVPNGLSGNYKLVLHTDIYNYVFESRFDDNNTVASATSVAISQAPAVDLRVQSVTAAPLVQPGQRQTIEWDVRNTGAGTARHPWTDQVFVSRDGTLGNALYLGSVTRNAALNGGDTYHASLDVTVPDLADGDWRVIVLTDAANQVYETGTADAESGNTGLSAATKVVHPDVQATDIVVGALTGGQAATVTWNVRNNGTGNVQGDWVERVYLSTDDVLDGSDVALGQVAVTGGLAAGASRGQSLSVTPPLSANGTYHVLVVSDADQAIREVSGEGNNVASATATIAQAPLPNLVVTGITAPASASAGRPVQVSWTVANTGDLAAVGAWSEQVWLSADDAIGGDQLLGNFYYTANDLKVNAQPGSTVVRTETLTLPTFAAAGAYKLVVRVDTGNALTEHQELDNAAIASTALELGAALNLTLSASSVAEQAGASAFTGTLIRSGAITSALTVNLSTGLNGLTVPTTVTIAAGQSSASFTVGVTDNTLVDGARAGSITASASGFASSAAAISVTDNDVAALKFSAPVTSLSEGFGPLTVTVTRNTTDNSEALTVNLSNAKTYKLTVPESVVIAAGATSATFQVTPVNDTVAEGNRNVDLTGAATGFISAGLLLDIVDNDIPVLTFNLDTSVVAEGAGIGAVHGTITRSIVTDTAVAIALFSDVTRVRTPSYVIIQAGMASVDFDITVQDNALADGDHQVKIAADVADAFSFVSLLGTRVEKNLLITDNDGATLSVSIDKSVLAEAAGANAATGTVTRNTPSTNALTVTLSSTDTSEATVPTTVVIPAGQQSATFSINAVQDGIQDGTQTATIVASANLFNSGSASVQVSDRELPDLQVSSITVPATAKTGATVDLDWTVLNAGLGGANSQWVDSVYLSNDSVLSGDDQLLGSFSTTTPLGQGASYSRHTTFDLGNNRVGQMYVFVISDNADNVTEISSANNTRVATIDVVPAFRATVSTAIEQSPGDTVIPLTGQVFDATTGNPQAFALITVSVACNGTVRLIDALSDSNGNFTAEFMPLPGEAGHYTISADHPAVTDRQPQDSFDIVGMRALQGINLNLLPGQTVTGQIEVKNLSPVALSNVRASVANLPPSVTLTFGDAFTLAGSATAVISYTATASADAPALSGNAPILIQADHGVVATATLSMSVTPLTPLLVSQPGYLASGMLLGRQTTVSVEVLNTGGAGTGPLQVQLPANLPWLTLASDQTLPSLAPGEKAKITLTLAPGAELPLQRYDGSIVVTSANSHVTVPFQFRAVSEASGDVKVTVTDEYSFFAEDKPNLAGATVQLLDPYTYEVVASAVTDATGIVNFGAVAEGPYTLQVSASSHDSVRATVHVTPGSVSEQDIFLHRQAVTYNWTVVPTEVQDHYKIVLESTFETEVPMPVVTVDDPFIMPLVVPGYESQFNITLRNHGLVNATQVQIRVPSDPDFIITPLISEIPVLAAKSEITVPVKISIRPDSPMLAALLAAESGDVSSSGAISDGAKILKCLGIDTLYTYECINNQWVSVPTKITPVVDAAKCLEKLGETAKKWLTDPKKVNLLSGACDVIGTVLSCMKVDSCLKALITTACKAATGAATGGWLGAGAGVLDNWKDILSCLCELAKKLDLGTGSGGPGGSGGGWSWGGGYGGYGSPYGTPVGYSIPYTGCSNTASSSTNVDITPQASNGVCAEVRLRIEQQAVITRTGFVGTLEVNNGRSDTTLQDVQMTLDIRDDQGNSANDKFVVRGPILQNVTLDEQGRWTIKPSTNGQMQYTFIPTLDAAPDAPKIYSMGGTLHYIDNGLVIDVPLLPARITVYPEAKLNLDYFWQRDVYADDPFTDQIEPSEPFALGLQVVNVGKGGAGNLSITSAQPQIIENEKGLLVDFKIIGSQVGANAGTPSLTVDLGNIAPGATQTAQWNLISSLQGKFKDFSASFEHLDDNGDLRTSLIQKVSIHELTRAVQVTSPSDDHIPDYLVNDVPDEGNLPDVLYMSTGGQAAVTVATNATLSGGGFTRTLSATMQSGWSYLKVPDLLPGYELTKVERSDGKILPVNGMVWRTDRSFKAGEPGATHENLLHLLDLDSTGSYTLTFAIVDHVQPKIDQLTGIAGGVHTDPVDTVDVTFSEQIDEVTLTAADVALSYNGTAVSTPDLTVTYVSGNTWRIAGLGAATGGDGNYRLTVNAQGITDLAGNTGTNSATVDWAMGATAPVILDVQAVVPALRNTAVASVDVTFSRAIDATTLDWTDLLLTRDGELLNLNSGVSISPLTASTFRINGLDSLTALQGHYELTVRAASIKDTGGMAGLGQFSQGWTTDTTAPTLTAIEQLATNPRNIVVQALEVTFSEAIDATTFDWHDITLTRNGTAENLITNEVTVEQVNATTWKVKGFNWKVGLDGEYVLRVNGAGITDLAGNAGTGAIAESWTMDIVDPLAPTNLSLTPDTGLSATDLLTNTLSLKLTGDLPESGLQVRLTDMTNNKELGYATVSDEGGTPHFTSNFTLSSAGQHRIRVRVADAAGNLSPDSFVEVFVDTTAPGVSSLSAVSPNPRTTPLGTVDVTLDESIQLISFDHQDISLSRDGVAVALDSTVTITLLSGNTYRIQGLEAFTTAAGSYQLTVSATGLTDKAGNTGIGAKSASWTTQATLPTGIRGLVFEDTDGSGTYNPASYNPEKSLAGRTVYLDANGNGALDAGEQSTTSAADGSYAFDNLANGNYRVSQVVPGNWIITTPSSNLYNVTVLQGHTVTGADFGNFLTGNIDGLKFNDLNANGTLDAGESTLSGWTIFLDKNANGILDTGEASTITGADGAFRFEGVAPGTVQLGEVLQTGGGVIWQRTTPAVPYHVKSGFSVSANLGNVQLGSISGAKINDLNGNGLRDANELGIAGWTIFLDNNGNGALDAGEVSTLTDATGNYSFTALLPGQYVVAEEQRAGWLQTTPLPAPVAVGISTAGSRIEMEADCACGGTWATNTGPAMIDYGKLAIDSALDTVNITDLRARPEYANLDGRGVATVVIDSGIDLDHRFFGPDLDSNGISDRIVYQYDFANQDNDASDVSGHGSHVTSIIAGQDALYPGVASGADIIALKVFEDSGRGYFSYLEQALQWVINNHEQYHVGVVNLSLGDNGNWTDDFSRYGLGDELAALAQTDVIVIAAAGNNYLQFGKMGLAYPASDPAAIAVGATWAADFGGPWTVSTGATNYATGADKIAAFSQRDTELMDTFAPGARFNGANATGGIQTMQGTSQAAAFVSGAATLAQQVARSTLGRGLTTGEFATLLRSTGDLILDGDDEVDNVVNTDQRFPRLNMEKLVAAIAGLDGATTGATGSGSTGSNQGTSVQQAAAGVHPVTLTAGSALTGKDFGNFKLGTVSGDVFNDTDGDGTRDAGETGQANVSVFLDANTNGLLDGGERSVLTDSLGHFTVSDLSPGATTVRLVAPSGLALSTASPLTFDNTSGLVKEGLSFGLKQASTAPVAHDDTVTTNEDTAVLIDVLANDAVAGVLNLSLATGTAAHGTVQIQAGKLLYTSAANFHGSDSVTYTLSDSQGHTSTATVSINVAPVNDAPVLNAIANQTVQEGSTLALDLTASDVDLEALRFSLLDAPQGASIDAATGRLTWTANGANTAPIFTVQVADAAGLTSTQQFSVQVQLGKLVLTAFESKSWGFAVRFNDVVDPAQLNVYGTSVPDVTLTGATTGLVKGSVVYDNDGKGFAFIRTGAPLLADTYSVQIRGAADGVTNARRGALDGDANGTAGGNHTGSFTIGNAPIARLRLPDFARGPGQAVNVPAAGTGLPITLTSTGTVTELRLRLTVDTDTFSVSELRRGADLPADATLTVTPVAGASGQFDIVIQRSQALAAGNLKLLSIMGTVPESARLGDAGAVVLESVFINGQPAPLAADAAVDIVAYPGDVNFDGLYTDADVKQMGRLVSNLDKYLPLIDDLDAAIVGDVDANGVLNSLDTALVLARTKAASTPMLPAVPARTTTPPPSATPAMASQTASANEAGTSATPNSLTVNMDGTYQNYSRTSSAVTPATNVLPLAGLRVVPSVVSEGAKVAAVA